MNRTDKRIQEDDCGRKKGPGKKIRKRGLLLLGLVLAGLVLFASMQKGVNEEKTDVAKEAGAQSAEKADAAKEAGAQSAEKTDTAVENGAQSAEKADAAEEAGAQSAEKTDTAEEAGAQSAEKADTSKENGAQSAEKTDASKEAEEQDRSYDFSLGFAGDICLADNYIPMQYLESIGSDDISDGIDPRYIEIMQGMDQMWINNEFVYSRRGEPLPTKMWTFCGDPDNVSYLKDLGVDIVGLANNHSFDFGEVSFLDTLETLEKAEIPYVGAGRNLEQASAPVYLEVDGFKIAYVAASRAEYTIYTPEATDTEPGILWCYDYTRFLESIKTAAENADYVIALPHWGVEHSTVLEDEQIYGAHALIDAGADAVIGAHPHILQGIEYYEGKPILYSLGNFWFDGYDIDTLVAELHIKGKRGDKDEPLKDAEVELKLYPGTQSGVYTALADTEEWKTRILQYLESISVNVNIDEKGVVHPDSE